MKLTNSWAISVFRYHFSCLKWTFRVLKDLNISKQRVLWRHKSQHYNSALERLYLAQTVGGRGLIVLESGSEQTVVSTATYLANSVDDRHCLSVRKTQDFQEGKSRWSLRKAATEILEKYKLPYTFKRKGTILGDSGLVLPHLQSGTEGSGGHQN